MNTISKILCILNLLLLCDVTSYCNNIHDIDRLEPDVIESNTYFFQCSPVIVVDSLNDSGFGSLRDAVSHVCDGDTIRFSPLLNGDTIKLETEIILNKNIVIIGNGQDSIFIDGMGDSRIFFITAGDTVRLSGVTIQNGGGVTQGGGIKSDGHLIVSDSRISRNAISASFGTFGGGVYISDEGSATFNNSSISGNSADATSSFDAYGGGIYISDNGSATFNNSSISGNTASAISYGSVSNANAHGGGVYISGIGYFANSTISGNKSVAQAYIESGSGGGVYISGNGTFINSTVSGNSVTTSNSNSNGGGIFIYNSGTVTFNNSIIAKNSAVDGSDIRNTGSIIDGGNNLLENVSGQSTITDSNGNIVGLDPLFVMDVPAAPSTSGDFRLKSCSPAINAGDTTEIGHILGLVDLGGQTRISSEYIDIGAFEFQGSAHNALVTNIDNNGPGSLRYMVDQATCPGDTIRFDVSTDGIPIVLTGPEIILDKNIVIIGNGPDSTILDGMNTSRIFHIPAGDTVTIDGIKMQRGNGVGAQPISAIVGGAILNQGHLTVSNSILSGNSIIIGIGVGGGVYNDGTLSFINSTLSGNNANILGGGVYNRGTATFTNSTLSGNTASSGGGVLNSSGTATFTNSTLSGNYATHGGGVYNDGGTLSFTNSILSGNNAPSVGGGVRNSGTATFTNSTLSGNTANDGGGVFNSSGTATFTNSTLSGNTASSGGGVFNSSGTATFTNSTLSGNTASSRGGGVFNWNSAILSFTNSIIAKNMDNGAGPDIFRLSGTITDMGHNLLGDTTSVGSDFTVSTLLGNTGAPLDPLFIMDVPAAPSTGGDLRLLPCSPAINAGTIDTIGLNLGLVDISGNPRVFEGRIDIGAQEYQGTVGSLTKLYVDSSATAGHNNGSSWSDAFTELSTVLHVARVCGGIDSIWVARGTYYPQDSLGTAPVNPRHKSFTLIDSIVVLGGFAPDIGIDSPEERDWESYPTVLSGDLMKDDSTSYMSIYDLDDEDNRQDNIHHIIDQSEVSLSNATVMDGFVLISGNADDDDSDIEDGGAMLLIDASPSISHCKFLYNSSDNKGGAVFADLSSSPVFTTVEFYKNYSDDDGGAIVIENEAFFIDCLFDYNETDDDGGAVNMRDLTYASFTDCIFMENYAYDKGGAIYIRDSAAMDISYTEFTLNYADFVGGAIYVREGSVVNIIQGDFIENEAYDAGGAICNGINESFFYYGIALTDNIKSSMSDFARPNKLKRIKSRALSSEKRTKSFDLYDFFGGVITIDSSSFHYNDADLGGAISSNVGIIKINQSEFIDNTADLGGAIYSDRSEFDIEDVVFEYNKSFVGGAIFSFKEEFILPTIKAKGTALTKSPPMPMFTSNLSVRHSIFDENYSFFAGGAICNGFEIPYFLSPLTLKSITKSSDPFDLIGGEVTIDSCIFQLNFTQAFGGALSNHGGEINILHSQFDSNGAYFAGGAIANITYDFIDSDPVIKEKSGLQKSTMDLAEGIIHIDESDFVNNVKAYYGGAIANSYGQTIDAKNSTFRSNMSYYSGGAIANGFFDFFLSGPITAKKLKSDPEPLFGLLPGGTVLIDSSDFISNHAFDDEDFFIGEGFGGSLYNFLGNIDISHSRIDSSIATFAGGGIMSFAGVLNIDSTSFSIDSSSLGGAITFVDISGILPSGIDEGLSDPMLDFSDPSLTISGSNFMSNFADESGGALELFESPVSINRSIFSGNESGGEGGAITAGGGVLKSTNSLFSGNYSNYIGGAISAYGERAPDPVTRNKSNKNSKTLDKWQEMLRSQKSGIHKSSVLLDSIILINTTFASNHADDSGGALYIQDINVDIANIIIWNNSNNTGTTSDNSGITQVNANYNFKNSVIQGSGGSAEWDTEFGTDNGGNLDRDPGFFDAPDPMTAPTILGDYRIFCASPVVDGGDPAISLSDAGAFDLAGNPRIVGTIDMGAYESDDLCQVDVTGAALVCGDTVTEYLSDTISGAKGYLWTYSGIGTLMPGTSMEELSIAFSGSIGGNVIVKVYNGLDTLTDTLTVQLALPEVCAIVTCTQETIEATKTRMANKILPVELRAIQAINSDGVVESGERYDFYAGESILLKALFEVEQGGLFSATIQSCISLTMALEDAIENTTDLGKRSEYKAHMKVLKQED